MQEDIYNKMATQTTQLNFPLTALTEPLEQYVHLPETKQDRECCLIQRALNMYLIVVQSSTQISLQLICRSSITRRKGEARCTAKGRYL